MEIQTQIPASSPVTQPATRSASEIAEQIFGHIDWMTPTEGYCECPGKKKHTTNDGRRDCCLYLDHVPTLYCLHANCSQAIEKANRNLRAAIFNGGRVGTNTLHRPTAEDKARLRERERAERIRLRASKSLPEILRAFDWPYVEIVKSSPVNITGNETGHWKLLLQKFQPNDLVWIGDKFDSGKEQHATHFRAVDEWLKLGGAPGPFICPAGFKNNSITRSNDNVINRRFLVVESDTLTRDQFGAVLRWLHVGCELKLVAVVDTAGKSLHGWFEFEEDLPDDLKIVLPALQCDPKLFTPSQPVRLPGALRDGKYQRLVFLSKGVAHV